MVWLPNQQHLQIPHRVEVSKNFLGAFAQKEKGSSGCRVGQQLVIQTNIVISRDSYSRESGCDSNFFTSSTCPLSSTSLLPSSTPLHLQAARTDTQAPSPPPPSTPPSTPRPPLRPFLSPPSASPSSPTPPSPPTPSPMSIHFPKAHIIVICRVCFKNSYDRCYKQFPA